MQESLCYLAGLPVTSCVMHLSLSGKMDAATYDLAPYLKLMSPPKSAAAMLNEINYNTAGHPHLPVGDDEFCNNLNTEECLHYLDKVSEHFYYLLA